MIPENITKQHIIHAIADVDRNGVPPGRSSTKYCLRYRNQCYPPKYLISIANKLANGEELRPSLFSGGRESNEFLIGRGFSIEGYSPKPARTKQPSRPSPLQRHNQRCSECKNVLIEMFREIYGAVKVDHKVHVPATIDGYVSHPRVGDLQKILTALQKYRGHREFVSLKQLHRCDLYIPSINAVVEFDESQHFTAARDVALAHYPADLPLGFDLREWRNRCCEINARDNDPSFRDEQRAWYDCLRDFLPFINGMSPTIRIYMGAFPWCSLDCTKSADIARFKKMFCPMLPAASAGVKANMVPVTVRTGSQETASKTRLPLVRRIGHRIGAAFRRTRPPASSVPSSENRSAISVATVVVGSQGDYTNDTRLALMRKVLVETAANTDLALFPAGYFTTQNRLAALLDMLTKQVSTMTADTQTKPVVCFGVDARDAKDQLAVAVNAGGLLGLARKFHPTKSEANSIEVAPKPFTKERGYPRIINVAGRRAFLAVCYDGFGIRQRDLANPGVDFVVDLIHGFQRKGEGPSGDVYFAKHALAGSSRQWNCPAFGAAVFCRRPISTAWPSGVLWNQGSKSTQQWKYSDNPLHPAVESRVADGSEEALVRVYVV